MKIATHPETFLQSYQLGINVVKYQFTYPITTFINAHQSFLNLTPDNALMALTAPGLMEHNRGEKIEGWLWKADALKLYELAYFATGDILELGTYAGLSTCIMSQAMIDSGRDARLVTVDIADYGWKRNAELTGVIYPINFHLGPAMDAVRMFCAAGRKFSFAFIDHSHTYEEVALVCPILDQVLSPGSFVQFHDYNDPRNGREPHYGVWQAVIDALPKTFEFCGVYGCSGLYRFTG